jgi:hypothetical protein
MKWVLFIFAGLAAIILIIALIGLMLPEAHRATQMARFNQPPDAIFAAIIGPQDWRGVVVTQLPPTDGRRTWREESGRHAITFEEVQSDRPRLYQSRIADKNLPFSGTWTWEITPTPDGCTCRITEEGEVFNPIFRFVSQLIIGHTKTIDDYLNALGRKFNQPVDIQP